MGPAIRPICHLLIWTTTPVFRVDVRLDSQQQPGASRAAHQHKGGRVSSRLEPTAAPSETDSNVYDHSVILLNKVCRIEPSNYRR